MKAAVVLLLSLTVSAPAMAAAGRLPTDVVPVLYDIAVDPDANALTFKGSETVQVDVVRPTKSVVLNAAELNVTRATFDGKPVKLTVDKEAQEITLTLPTTAAKGRHSVAFAWTGTINRSAAGLFAIDYTNTDGSNARMLATQFEAPDARRFAPMWDEPAFKATFRLKTVAPKGMTAFSNMPASSATEVAGGKKLYSFAETPIMSSYLLFLGVGDVERKTIQVGKTQIGVISRQGVVDQGDYALSSARRLLGYYNDYFGQPYPLPKLDMIAGPGSSQFFGAMENWGAIFYFENELLFDPKIATESNRQRIHTVVAHEMAHQWFGDLVTMRWWNDLWLNEGFASWMENKASADLNPAWKSDAAAVAFAREAAMRIDATAATHPIIGDIQTVDQIGQAFDGITYAKGQAVIGMMESTVGPDAFRKGIRSYMAKYKYSNAVTDQLWTELSAAADRPVTTIAHDFTLQGGVPLVKLSGTKCVAGSTVATLTQGRFGLDAPSKQPQTWHVPIRAQMVGGGSAEGVVTGSAPTELAVKGCGSIVLNAGKGSYVRVMYDEPAHAAIVRDYRKLDLKDRLGTLGDDFALAIGGYQDLTRWTSTMGQIGVDADPLEWSMLTGEISNLTDLYDGTPLEPQLRAKAIAMLSPVLERIGDQAKPDESPLVTNLRETLLSTLGANGDAKVTALARRYVAALADNPNALPAAIRAPILSTYAINATPQEWDKLLDLAEKETSPVAKNRFVRLLGAARNDDAAAKAVALLKSDRLTAPQKASLLRGIAGSHPDLAFDWAVANHALAEGFIEESSKSTFIVGLGGGSNDPAMPGKINAYAARYLPEESRKPAERTIATISVRQEEANRIRSAVQTWLNG